jgi:uridylate kinase
VQAKYKRILLKFSGEALIGGSEHQGIDPVVVDKLIQDISQLIKLKVQVGLVVGGGNLFRGQSLENSGLVDRVTGDQIGMLSTIINALVFRHSLEKAGISTRIVSAIPISGLVNAYNQRTAISYLEEGKVVIFAAGTGNPLITTDSAASLRALEIGADVLIKATKVDGIYSADPQLNQQAIQYKKLTYDQVLKQELAVMDLNAFIQCRDYNMKIIVFNLNKPGSLLRIIAGEEEGTIVEN